MTRVFLTFLAAAPRAVVYAGIGPVGTTFVAEKGKRKTRSRNLVVADAVGVAHFVVANFCIAFGQFTGVFKGVKVGVKYPGLDIVYRYFDAPVVAALGGLTNSERGDVFYTFLVAELVIIVSSMLYGLIAFAFLKIASLIFE